MNTNPSSHRYLRLSVAPVCLLACIPALALAQTTTRRVDTTPPTRDVRVVETNQTIKKTDRDFLEKAAKASMSEVAISRVAATRTSNPEVRRFAQMMIEDHENANEQLGSLASGRGISLPAKDPAPDRWEKRAAKSFDKDYVDKMVSDHEDVVKLFEKQARNGEDADTVAFARQNLPKMQAHLQHALDLKRALTEKKH
jgi:putative membrane protein